MIVVCACFRTEIAWVPSLPGLRMVRTGMGEAAVGSLEEEMLDLKSTELILSTGFCGGLAPRLGPGDLVLAEAIHHHGEMIAVNRSLLDKAVEALARAKIGFVTGVVKTSSRIVQSAQEKRRLREEGAIAVDMESGVLARWAHSKKIGFLSLRAILDPADCALPFALSRTFSLSILGHPVVTLRLLRLSLIAGRAIGQAIPAVANNLGRRLV